MAVAPTSRKEGEKGACELPVARRMLGKMDLSDGSRTTSKKVEPSRNRVETRTTAIFDVDPVEVKFAADTYLVVYRW